MKRSMSAGVKFSSARRISNSAVRLISPVEAWRAREARVWVRVPVRICARVCVRACAHAWHTPCFPCGYE